MSEPINAFDLQKRKYNNMRQNVIFKAMVWKPMVSVSLTSCSALPTPNSQPHTPSPHPISQRGRACLHPNSETHNWGFGNVERSFGTFVLM